MRWIYLMIGVLGSGLAHAKDGDTFRPFVSLSLTRDDNILRLDKNEPAVVGGRFDPNPVRADTYRVLSAGATLDWKYSRQQVQATAAVNKTEFGRYTSLDYKGQDLRLNWSWQLGNRLRGTLGATHSVTQTNISDLDFYFLFLTGSRVVNNLLTRDRTFLSVEWSLHPRWKVSTGLTRATSSNSQLIQRPLDSEENTVDLKLTYLTPKGGQLGGQVLRRDTLYPSRQLTGFSDRRYTQTEFNLLANWVAGGKSSGQFLLGLVDRQSQNLAARNFSGVTARATASYTPTGKTLVSLAAYREVNGAELANANFRLNTGMTLSGLWRVSNRVSLRANGQIENHNYNGDPGLVSTTGVARRDRIRQAGVTLSYVPLDLITLDLGLQYGERRSNLTNGSYAFTSVFANARADF